MNARLRLLVAHGRFHFGALGWPGWVGLALLVVAVALQLGAVKSAATRVDELKVEQEELRAEAAQNQRVPVVSSAERLKRYYAFLPNASAPPEAIAKIHAAAEARGVQLQAAEYKALRETTRDVGAQLMRYQIAIPARGTYPQLRAWLADVMNGLPSTALDEISLRRENVANESLEARLRLTLFFRAM